MQSNLADKKRATTVVQRRGTISRNPNRRLTIFNSQNNISSKIQKTMKPVKKKWDGPEACSSPRSQLAKATTARREGFKKHGTADSMKEEIDHLTRDAVFALKFQGKIVKDEQIFRTIEAFDPVGRPKKLPYTQYNLMRHKKYLKIKYQKEKSAYDKL